MIFLKTEDEIELMRAANLLVAATLAEVGRAVRSGISTAQLDRLADEFIRDHGATPTFKGFPNPYGGPFPGSICTSVNDVVVHGIPYPNQYLRDGDIISVDCGAVLDGYHGDFCYTFEVGEVSEEVHKLCVRTKESLYKAIEVAKAGNTIGDIGHTVEQYVGQFHYGVVRELCGHGIGKDMHEKPDIPNYGTKGQGMKLAPGMCICIEPMINMGSHKIVMENDGWTIRTRDHKPSAHYEHQMIITEHGTEVISSYKLLGEVIGTEELY